MKINNKKNIKNLQSTHREKAKKQTKGKAKFVVQMDLQNKLSRRRCPSKVGVYFFYKNTCP